MFNEEGHVLLTQEGFDPHVGHWYLPAGRVDPGETIVVRLGPFNTERQLKCLDGKQCSHSRMGLQTILK